MTKQFSTKSWAATILAVAIQSSCLATQAFATNDKLTPFGAERASNADNSIPEWTGGLAQIPAGWKSGDTYVDPYADDKPIFTITNSNLKQYADKLNDGQLALFAKHADYKINVYPSRRSFAAPQAIYANSMKNAESAVLTEGGNAIEKAYSGVPFPAPETGVEAVWNHLLRWQGYGVTYQWGSWLVYPDGTSTRSSTGELNETYPYYTTQDADGYAGSEVVHFLAQYQGPQRRNGEVTLVKDALNQAETPREAWQYIPGQRRVRRAPTLSFDNPNGPAAVADETYIFNGSPDRYEWKIVGKQEMYVPYNQTKYYDSLRDDVTSKQVLQPYFPNPEFSRWELHRVWVVEGVLKEGSRHVYSKRRLYLDEDSWAALLADNYDAQGQVWRTLVSPSFVAYDVPALVTRGEIHFDLQSDIWMTQTVPISPLEFKVPDASMFSVSYVRKIGRR